MSVPPDTTAGGPLAAAGPPDGQPSSAAWDEPSLLDQHPELIAAGGFAGGFLLAAILKRLGN